jgi:aspartate/methionine/tyrosine aminotransferase
VATLLALRQKGKNRVAVLEPFYTYHKRQIEEVYGECKYHVPTNADFSPNWDTLEAAFSGPEALHGIIVTNPGNPTGKVWSKEDMLRLVSIVKKANAVLIVDEIYCDMIWKGRHFSPLEEGVSPNVVVCRGWAKSLAAQSWRIGFCVTDPDFAQEILTQHDPVYIAVNWQQYSLAKYLTGHLADYKRHVAENSRIMQHNWKLLSELLQSVLGWTPLEPQGSMYGLFKHTEENDGAALRRALDHGIGVAAGSMFFGTGDTERTGLIRIHYGFDAATVDRICASVREHKKKH